jgi:hypothetical protein
MSYTPSRKVVFDLTQTAADGGASDVRRLFDDADAAPTNLPGFRRRPNPTPSLMQNTADGIMFFPERLNQNCFIHQGHL